MDCDPQTFDSVRLVYDATDLGWIHSLFRKKLSPSDTGERYSQDLCFQIQDSPLRFVSGCLLFSPDGPFVSCKTYVFELKKGETGLE